MKRLVMVTLTTLLALPSAARGEGAVDLVDDFADGNLRSRTHGGWVALGERHYGGPTVAFADAVKEEGEGVGVLSYFVVGKEDVPASAYMALNLGQPLEPAADLSGYRAVRFRCKTDGTGSVTVMLMTQEPWKDEGAVVVVHWWVRVKSEGGWGEVEVPFAELTRADEEEGRPTLSRAVMLAIGSREHPSTHMARVFIDDVRLVRGVGDFPRAADTVEREFEGITFSSPDRGWVWDAATGIMDVPKHSTKITFRPHSGLESAAKLRQRFKSKMETVGMKSLEMGQLETLDIGGREVGLYGATCKPPAMLTRMEPELGDGIEFQVLVLATDERTYEVECRMPAAEAAELRGDLRNLMGSIRVKE